MINFAMDAASSMKNTTFRITNMDMTSTKI